MYFTFLQGRVPAWNLAGILPPDPTSPGPGGPSPGAVSVPPGTLAHPLPHYSGAYGGQPPGHYPHLLPQSSETVPVSHHQWPPNMEAAAVAVAATEASSAMHYKMDPDAAAMSAMYYPPVHQVSHYFKKCRKAGGRQRCDIFSRTLQQPSQRQPQQLRRHL